MQPITAMREYVELDRHNTKAWNYYIHNYARYGFYITKAMQDWIDATRKTNQTFSWTGTIRWCLDSYLSRKDNPITRAALDRFRDPVGSCREGHDLDSAIDYHVDGPTHPRVHKAVRLNEAMYSAVIKEKEFPKFVRLVLIARMTKNDLFLHELTG